MFGDRGITILHVSDMQFGAYHQFPSKSSDENTLLESILEDIEQLKEDEGFNPDLLICSGDLAEWGFAQEFAQATSFLGALGDKVGVDRARVIIIPGNHDINRNDCLYYFQQAKERNEDAKAPWAAKWKKYEEAFNDFYKSVGNRATFQLDQPWSLFVIPELEVVVAGLNSTWTEGHDWPDDKSLDKFKEKHQIIHAGSCWLEQWKWFKKRLKAPEFAGWLKIGAIHHNIEPGARQDDQNLRDAANLETYLGRYLDIVLHGHTHTSRWNRVRDKFPWFAVGSAGLNQKIRPYGTPNQYQFLVLTANGVNVRGRHYMADMGQWADDQRISTESPGKLFVDVTWRNVRRFVQPKKLLNLEEFLLAYHKNLYMAAAASQAAVLAADPNECVDFILTVIRAVVTAWSDKRDKPELKVYANYQLLCDAETLTEKERKWIKIRTGGEPTHYLVTKTTSAPKGEPEPLEKLALPVDFGAAISAALPGSPMAVLSREPQYIDDTNAITLGEDLSLETKEDIKAFFGKHYHRFKSFASFPLKDVGAAEQDKRNEPLAVVNIEASQPFVFGDADKEKEKSHLMLRPLICMLETAVGSRRLRETLAKMSQQG